MRKDKNEPETGWCKPPPFHVYQSFTLARSCFYWKNVMVDDTTLDAAWFALKPFLAPEDCSRRVPFFGIVTMNPNAILAMRIIGYKFNHESKYKFFYFNKKNLRAHLDGKSTYYFRSKGYKNFYRTGYGNSLKKLKDLPFAKVLGVTNRMEQDRTQSNIVIGIDIDAHNGETDVHEMQDIINFYLKEFIYWEESTNGNGLHGYIKFRYPTSSKTELLYRVVFELFMKFNWLAESRGVQAKLDLPCCFPFSVEFCKENPYRLYQIDIPVDFYAKIKRTQALKIPRFNCTGFSILDNICKFYHNPFLSEMDLYKLLDVLEQIKPIETDLNNIKVKDMKEDKMNLNKEVNDINKIDKSIKTDTIHPILYKGGGELYQNYAYPPRNK